MSFVNTQALSLIPPFPKISIYTYALNRPSAPCTTCPIISDPLFDLPPVQPILQMYLKIVDPSLGPWRIQFTRAIQAFDPRVIHKLRIRWCGFIGTYADWQVADSRDSRVAHCAFKKIVGIRLLELQKRLAEPWRWCRLTKEF